MRDDDDADYLLSQLSELQKLVRKAGGRNGGKACKETLREVRKHLNSRDPSSNNVLSAMENLAEFLMRNR